MLQITVKVEGMRCGMCESHVNSTVRNAFDVKKVSSSHSKGQTVILSEKAIPEEALRKAINDTGYTVKDIKVEEYQRKKLFGLF